MKRARALILATAVASTMLVATKAEALTGGPFAFQPNTTLMATGDFTGDRIDDIFFLTGDPAQGVDLQAFMAVGRGGERVLNFGEPFFLESFGGLFDPATTVITAGDYNGDGRDDVFLSSANASGFNSYIAFGGYGTNNYGFGHPQHLATYSGVFDPSATVLTSGDYNNDGLDDVFFLSGSGFRANSYIAFGGYGTNAFNFGHPQRLGSYFTLFDPAATVLTSGDYNNDGLDDVFFMATTVWGSNSYIAFGGYDRWNIFGFGQPQLLETYAGLFDPASTVMTTGDFNGDRVDDVFFSSMIAGQANSYIAFGGYGPNLFNFGHPQYLTTYGGLFNPDTTVLTSGDYNGDGTDDVFFVAAMDGFGSYMAFGRYGTNIFNFGHPQYLLDYEGVFSNVGLIS